MFTIQASIANLFAVSIDNSVQDNAVKHKEAGAIRMSLSPFLLDTRRVRKCVLAY